MDACLQRRHRLLVEMALASMQSYKRMSPSSSSLLFPTVHMLLFAQPHLTRTHDIPLESYRPDTDMYLLFGVREALSSLASVGEPAKKWQSTAALFTLTPHYDSSAHVLRFVSEIDLFVASKDPTAEMWHGERTGPGDAFHQALGGKTAYTIHLSDRDVAALVATRRTEMSILPLDREDRPLSVSIDVASQRTCDNSLLDTVMPCLHERISAAVNRSAGNFVSSWRAQVMTASSSSKGKLPLADVLRRNELLLKRMALPTLPMLHVAFPSQGPWSEAHTAHSVFVPNKGMAAGFASVPSLVSTYLSLLKQEIVFSVDRDSDSPNDASQKCEAVANMYSVDGAQTTSINLELCNTLRLPSPVLVRPETAALSPLPAAPYEVKQVAFRKVQDARRHVLAAYRSHKSPNDLAMFLLTAYITADMLHCAKRVPPTGFVSEMYLFDAMRQHVLSRKWAVVGNPTAAHMSPTLVVAYASLSESVFAYPPVIALNENSLSLHHIQYQQKRIKLCDGKGSTISPVRCLIDCGVEALLGGIYPTDCTRCFSLLPTSRGDEVMAADGWCQVYEAVLRVQRKILQRMKVGVRISVLQGLAVSLLHAELVRLGVMQEAASHGCEGLRINSDASLVSNVFFPHGFGHWFGFDIHELQPPSQVFACCQRSVDSGRPAPVASVLTPCSMHTVEPGLYIPSDTPRNRHLWEKYIKGTTSPLLHLERIPEQFRDIGIRIEDNVFVLPTELQNREMKHDEHIHQAAATSRNTDDTEKVVTGAEKVVTLFGHSREQYLNSAVAAFADVVALAVLDHASSPRPLVLTSGVVISEAVVAAVLSAVEANSAKGTNSEVWSRRCWSELQAMFVEEQSLSILGRHCPCVEDSLHCQAECTLSQANQKEPGAHPGQNLVSSSSSWYPFDIIVTTASAPKDLRFVA